MCCICGISDNRQLAKVNKRGFLAGEVEAVDEKQEDNEDGARGR